MAGDTRERILHAAADLFARKGYHATGMSELEQAAGIGRGALYYHIGSKEDLLFVISSRHVIDMVDYGEKLLASDRSSIEKIQLLGRMLMRTIAANLSELTVFFREFQSLTGQRRTTLLDLRDRFEAVWSEILEEGQAAGVFRTADPILVKGLLGLHNYSYLWLDPEGPLDPDEIAARFGDLMLRGLLTDAGWRQARDSGVWCAEPATA